MKTNKIHQSTTSTNTLKLNITNMKTRKNYESLHKMVANSIGLTTSELVNENYQSIILKLKETNAFNNMAPKFKMDILSSLKSLNIGLS